MAIAVLCLCCQLRVVENLARDSSGRRVCEACRSDQHGTLQGRDDVHGWLWERHCKALTDSTKRANERAAVLATSAKEVAEAAVAVEMDELRAQVADLQALIHVLGTENSRLVEQVALDYEDGISEKLKDHVETTALAHAKGEKDRAYSRENEVLSLLLLDIEPQHRGKHGPASTCTCGKLTVECREWQAIDPIREQLPVWEKQQLRRMAEGRPFGLPRRHPTVKQVNGTTPRWDFKGLPERIARLDNAIPRAERRAS